MFQQNGFVSGTFSSNILQDLGACEVLSEKSVGAAVFRSHLSVLEAQIWVKSANEGDRLETRRIMPIR